MKTVKINNKYLPLFEYAQQFEDHDNYEDFDDFFIHCLESNGYSDKENAQFMGLSAQGYSARKSRVIHENTPRFSLTYLYLYVLRTGDPRPAAYLEWLTRKAKEPNRNCLIEKGSRAIEMIPKLQHDIEKMLEELKQKVEK